MDSVTQIVLGASVGEFVLGKKAGNKAALWGAIAGTVPDLDVLGTLFLNPAEAILFHRGFMHSILFSVLFAPVLGWMIYRIYRKKISWRAWTNLAFWGLITHPLLDCFTAWGTQLFWPFEYRVSFYSVFVIDLHYTLPFMILLILALRKPKESSTRRKLNNIGLIYSTTYLFLGLVVHSYVVNKFNSRLHSAQISFERLLVKPMPFTAAYWEGVAETKDGFYNGCYSVYGGWPERNMRFIPKNHALDTIDHLNETVEYKTLQKISLGYYSLERADKGLYFCDLRFGCTDGITASLPNEVIFRYHLYKKDGKTQFKKVRTSYNNLWSVLGEYESRIFGK